MKMSDFRVIFFTCLLFLSCNCIKIAANNQQTLVAGLNENGNQTLRDSDVAKKQLIEKTKKLTTSEERLKHYLLIEKGYDKGLRPVMSANSTTHAKIDFTPRQILTLDEKRQVLRTFVHLRLFWMDEFLTWNPAQFDNISSVVLSSNVMWRPDIVLYEDTSNWDYKPRIFYTEVFHNGAVRYLEPIVFTTSCSINIAHFPFDYQICTLTFESWTFPTSKFDITAKRNVKELQTDIKSHLIKTGEWSLREIDIQKRSQSFAGLLTTSGTREQKYVMMDPFSYVADVAPTRVTDSHWSEIIYVLYLRRNSSLYMQSMLFPAILLTSIALLGFYLPPDSGERIGLQITIMLTFMVFLLNVGEMFPASSTGPYLGIYYVICMGLLGINLSMTVLVLFVHHMPVAQTMEIEKGPNGEFVTKISPPPLWVRWILILTRHPLRKTLLQTKSEIRKNKSRNTIVEECDEEEHNKKAENYDQSNGEIFELQNAFTNQSLNNNSQNDCIEQHDEYNAMKNLLESLSKIRELLQNCDDHSKEEEAANKCEAEWKIMARVVDKICLKVYFSLLSISHIAVLTAAMLDANTVVDPLNKDL